MPYSPRERRPHVVVLLFQLVQPRRILWAPELRLGFFRQGQEVFGMGASYGFCVVALLELFQRELADGLEHHEARLGTLAFLLPQQALVQERGNYIQRVLGKVSSWVAHRLYGLQGAPARESRQPRKERLLPLVEHLVAPRDGVPEGPLPLGQVPRPAGKQLEAAVQSRQHRLGREQLYPRRCELYGQG